MSIYTLWGPATWYLFHTLAEKIKDDKFLLLKNEMLMLIKNVCSSLPCPDCSIHASHLLASYRNYHIIRTKDDFKKFLFNFHNIVNGKANNQAYSVDILNKYQNANLAQIFQYWYANFITKSGGISNALLINSMGRDNVKKSVQRFLQTNSHHFII